MRLGFKACHNVEARGEGEETTALGRLDDVARYLSRHRVKGGSRVMVRQEGSGAAQLIEIAQEERADLTGAYGHSSLGEWVFGGMTRELLSSSPICCLMSHDLALGVLVRAVSHTMPT
jgi:nucleotide-binding universal stress UspA family protein